MHSDRYAQCVKLRSAYVAGLCDWLAVASCIKMGARVKVAQGFEGRDDMFRKAVAGCAILLFAAVPHAALSQSSAGKVISVKPPLADGRVYSRERPAPETKCEVLSEQIERILMDMALDKALGEKDDSAPRAQVRATKRVASFLQIQLVKSQMADMSCEPYGALISETRYAKDAAQCAAAVLSPTTPNGYGLPMSCKMSEWQSQ